MIKKIFKILRNNKAKELKSSYRLKLNFRYDYYINEMIRSKPVFFKIGNINLSIIENQLIFNYIIYDKVIDLIMNDLYFKNIIKKGD